MINYENHNLWLLDERLTFHTFAASDLPLNNYMDTQNDDRPDVVAFSDIDEETRVAKSVSVIELKKTQRKEFDESPIAQMLRMVKGIKEGQIVLQSVTIQWSPIASVDFNKILLLWGIGFYKKSQRVCCR